MKDDHSTSSLSFGEESPLSYPLPAFLSHPADILTSHSLSVSYLIVQSCCNSLSQPNPRGCIGGV